MQLRAFFDYDTSTIRVMVIPGSGVDEWSTDPTVKALSVEIHGAGEILRVPFVVDGERIDKTKGIIAELEELHVREPAGTYARMDTCEHCRELCHSREGLSCDTDDNGYMADGAWPCATMAIVEKYR